MYCNDTCYTQANKPASYQLSRRREICIKVSNSISRKKSFAFYQNKVLKSPPPPLPLLTYLILIQKFFSALTLPKYLETR